MEQLVRVRPDAASEASCNQSAAPELHLLEDHSAAPEHPETPRIAAKDYGPAPERPPNGKSATDTLADEDIVRQYLNEISHFGLLTKEDEARLAQTIEAGRRAAAGLALNGLMRLLGHQGLPEDSLQGWMTAVQEAENARNEFIQANLRLVVSIAKKSQGRGLSLLDLIQEGNLGLIVAVEKFDWRQGFKFSTYATWWIRQAVTRAIANKGRTVRLPVHKVDELNQMHRAEMDLIRRLGRKPTAKEVADELGLDFHKFQELKNAQRISSPASIDAPVRQDRITEMVDFVEDTAARVEPIVVSLLERDEAVRLIKALDEQQREVITLRYGLDGGGERTLRAIGEMFNLNREHVRRIIKRALEKMREEAGASGR